MSNYPAGVTTAMIDDRYREPKAPFNVLVKFRVKDFFEPWNVKEIQDYQDAVSQAQTLVDHGYEYWKIEDAEGHEYRPNLKARNV